MLRGGRRLAGLLPAAAAALVAEGGGAAAAAGALAAAARLAPPSHSQQRQQRHLGRRAGGLASLAHPAAAAPEPTPASTSASAGGADSTAAAAALDPFALVRGEVDAVSERLRLCVASEVPTLARAAEYFFKSGAEGKRLRATVVLLLSSALATAETPPVMAAVDVAPPSTYPPALRRRQQRVAEIAELIHVASLLHDDVLDGADTRRGRAAVNAAFGNKVAILAGDFLLARASVSLAALRDPEVILLMSQVLENLVAGEVAQMVAAPAEAASLEFYLHKSFLKTASLVSNSCRSAAVLAGGGGAAAEAAADYGRHLGLAFQLVDDVLDFTATPEELGKPAAGADLRAGLATAPVLLAAEAQPALGKLIARRFSAPGDAEAALALVAAGDGVARARALAAEHAAAATTALGRLSPPATGEAERARAALAALADRVLTRRK
jgi:geranyl diphosphate synthase